MKHISIVIKGKVQGVFFRASAKDRAEDLNISGYVENRRNGSVFIEAEGEEGQLAKLVAWCNDGPPHAHVSSVEVEDGEVSGMKGFTIRR